MTLKILKAGRGMPVLCAAAAILALTGTLACAQDAPKPDSPPHHHAPPSFDDIDTNHDGMISKAEFDAFHAAHPMGPHGMHDGKPDGPWGKDRHWHGRFDLKTLDTNGDGKISLEEFEAPMKKHFDKLDANHDGFLEPSEFPKGPPHGDGPPPGDAPPAAQ